MTVRISRRSLVCAWSSFAAFSKRASAQSLTPVALGHGIEIRDYRVFEQNSVRRFMVELSNTSDTSMDTPSVGFTIQQSGEQIFGWAVPAMDVLHARSAALLFGVTPPTVHTDHDWGTPQWIICDPPSDNLARSLDFFDVDWEHTTELIASNDVLIRINLRNNGIPLTAKETILGLVRDRDGRACGVTWPAYINHAKPGATVEIPVRWGPNYDYIANPVAVLDDAEGCTVDLTLQTWPRLHTDGCEGVLPWEN